MTPDRNPRRHAYRYDELELYVEPAPVRRQVVEPARHPGRWQLVLGLIAFLVVLTLAALATPRPGPAISPSPTQAGAPRSVEDVGAPLIVPAAVLSGTATWYCGPGQRGTSACTIGYGPDDLVAAIDPTLGLEKGQRIRVRHGGRQVTVRIVDVCACGGRRLADLTSGAFTRLAPLGRGVIAVTIEVLGSTSSATLPPTDTEATR